MLAMPALAQSEEDVTFTADTVSSNAETGVMTATGNVVIVQGQMELKADRVDYDRESGTAEATGNVILTDHTGGVHYTENLKLEKSFSKAFAEPVISKLVDGSWVGAASVAYEADTLSSFDSARFTPCDCDFKNGATPAWGCRAAKPHDPKTATVYHRNVTMRLASIPILYMPLFRTRTGRYGGVQESCRHVSIFIRSRHNLFTILLLGDQRYSRYGNLSLFSPIMATPYSCGTVSAGMRLILMLSYRWSAQHIQEEQEDVVAIDASFSTIIGDDWLTTPASIVQVRIRSCVVTALIEQKH